MRRACLLRHGQRRQQWCSLMSWTRWRPRAAAAPPAERAGQARLCAARFWAGLGVLKQFLVERTGTWPGTFLCSTLLGRAGVPEAVLGCTHGNVSFPICRSTSQPQAEGQPQGVGRIAEYHDALQVACKSHSSGASTTRVLLSVCAGARADSVHTFACTLSARAAADRIFVRNALLWPNCYSMYACRHWSPWSFTAALRGRTHAATLTAQAPALVAIWQRASSRRC